MAHQSPSRFRARLVDQAASDLEENRRRRLESAKKIELLKQEEALLIDILTLAERYEGLSEPPPLPEQAQEEPVLDGSRPLRTADSPPAAAAYARRPLDVSARRSLRAVLREGAAGRTAGEAPEPQSPQVVRNTLESLVAKGHILRHKQRRSVMYTVAESGRGALATPAS